MRCSRESVLDAGGGEEIGHDAEDDGHDPGRDRVGAAPLDRRGDRLAEERDPDEAEQEEAEPVGPADRQVLARADGVGGRRVVGAAPAPALLLRVPAILRRHGCRLAAPAAGQIRPSRTAWATAWDRVRTFSFVTTSWITFLIVRSL